mmetsp:Transcript_52370/g.114221  ORF Transcript_52370/g.114221 Transcript_52370/m.114221 type:complete len:88 (-) Transcript_52370:429-692(-)
MPAAGAADCDPDDKPPESAAAEDDHNPPDLPALCLLAKLAAWRPAAAPTILPNCQSMRPPSSDNPLSVVLATSRSDMNWARKGAESL